MEMHLATVWESIADAIPDHIAVTYAGTSRRWADYDDRAARLAAAYTAAGLGPDSKIGLFLYNGNEYMEAQYGAFKMRGVPVNINYRYTGGELRYLLDNSDAEALVFHSSLGGRVASIVEQLPDLSLLIEVDDGEPGQVPGTVAYDDVIAGHDPMSRISRDESDIYMLYTGGTTGMPKGVMYAMGGLTAGFVNTGFGLIGATPTEDASLVASTVVETMKAGGAVVSLPCAPLMHGTGLWLGCYIAHLAGGHVVTLTGRSFDAHEVLATIERHRATMITIVGDTIAKPLLRALDEGRPGGGDYDTSSIALFGSSGVMWTAEVKQQMIDRMEHVMLIDAIASSEGGMGTQITAKGLDATTGTFQKAPETRVFTDDGREVTPGSDEIGMVAAGGNVPLGYYKDEEKSARTFRVIDGLRYSFPGDLAKVAADGSLILLGRGSQVINSGGEKIFPEEVEEAVKRVDGVFDCLVVGIDDETFGQAVTAVVSRDEGADVDADTIIESVKQELARYKAPKTVVFVEEVPRAPNGKADYSAAQNAVMAAAAAAGSPTIHQ